MSDHDDMTGELPGRPGDPATRAAAGPGRGLAPASCAIRARAWPSGAARGEAAGRAIAFRASWGAGVASGPGGRPAVAFGASRGAGPAGLPGLAELLAAALAACLLKNLNRAGEFLSFRCERAEADVAARRQDAPPAAAGGPVLPGSAGDHRGRR